MSLAKRLASVNPHYGYGCGTCRWLKGLPEEDRAAFTSWVAVGGNIAQLWEIATNDEDAPYTLSIESMRNCVRKHHRVDT